MKPSLDKVAIALVLLSAISIPVRVGLGMVSEEGCEGPRESSPHYLCYVRVAFPEATFVLHVLFFLLLYLGAILYYVAYLREEVTENLRPLAAIALGLPSVIPTSLLIPVLLELLL